ncbi:hypothetical protein HK102_005398 [Quaeritorhiza haematococci]|nr:hypothetical protein HK102_005398 [Quaeritorhiza haematococci]
MRWEESEPIYRYFGCEALLDTAHKSLQAVEILSAVPDTVIAKFLTRCSSVLRAVSIKNSTISDTTLILLGQTCPDLRELVLNDCPELTSEGVVDFVQLCGSSLRCLRLHGVNMDRYAFHKVVEYCHSLESVNIFFNRFKDGGPDSIRWEDAIDLTRKLGPKLAYLALTNDTKPVASNVDDFICSIADCCPNIKGIDLFCRRRMEQFPVTTSGMIDSEAEDQGDNGKDFIREDTLKRLFERCKKLYSFNPRMDDIGSDELSARFPLLNDLSDSHLTHLLYSVNEQFGTESPFGLLLSLDPFC